MQLQHEFPLPISPEKAWDTLLDVPRVARCMPGATLDHADGDEFSGRVTLKVGPLKMAYHGDIRITDKDAVAGRLVLVARGKEERGAGTAEATVTASLRPAAGGTLVALATDLALTGRAARFGQGLVNEVAGTVLSQFADRLAHDMAAGADREPVLQSVPAEQVSPAPSAPADSSLAGAPLDVVAVLKPLLATRAQLALGFVLGMTVALLFGRRTCGRRTYAGRRS